MSFPKDISVMYFGFVLLELIVLRTVVCQDCDSGEPIERVFANVTANATFHLQTNRSCCIHVQMERVSKGSYTYVMRLDIFDFDSSTIIHSFGDYSNRVYFTYTNITNSTKNLHITMSDIGVEDKGIYLISHRYFEKDTTCFKLHVLGSPKATLQLTPQMIEEGSSGILQCLSTSTSVPPTHNLTIETRWYVNGLPIQNLSKFAAAGNEMFVYYLTRDDNGSVVKCEVKEQMGLTTWVNETIQMNWGPDPGPYLQPPGTFYHLASGESIPNINCSAHCYPHCDISWKKLGGGTFFSSTRMLSLGVANENIFGGYICTATRLGTYRRYTKTAVVVIQERKDNTTLAAVGLGLAAVALLITISVSALLLRQGACSKNNNSAKSGSNTRGVSSSTNRVYEDLDRDRHVQESYDAVNLDVLDNGRDITAEVGNTTCPRDLGNEELYENNTAI